TIFTLLAIAKLERRFGVSGISADKRRNPPFSNLLSKIIIDGRKVMHDEDCQLPSLDWLTDSVKRKSSTPHIPNLLISNFSQQKKYSAVHQDQKNASNDVDFSKEAIKPPYSYAELITLAMRHYGQSKVLLSDIYDYVRKNFAWYRKTDITWQNSIRHNLSLNKQFIKLPRKKGEKGKGSYWMLDHNAMDSSGLKMKRNASITHCKMKVLEKGCKPTLNPAMIREIIIINCKQQLTMINHQYGGEMKKIHLGQSTLPRFTDAFANGTFENSLSPNMELEKHPWQEIDLKITDECLFFDLSISKH
uniref:Forkhead box protein fkh-2 n=1 Tax=Wuchereria bancrofti TaxID=6293 RepID=A0A1I8EXB5_WUCBA